MAFAVRGSGGGTLEIDVYDAIGESWWGDGVTAKAVRRVLKENAKATLIKLRVNSRGGDVWDGFAIYELLREHQARVEADVDALAASMASVIIMAADEIRMAPGAMLMIHNPWTIALGEAEDLRSTAELLDKLQGQIADAYAARTKLARDRVIEMMNAETWMTPSEALALGFADEVKPAKGAESAKALAGLDLRGFERAPAVFAAAVDAAKLRRIENRNEHPPAGRQGEDMNEDLRKQLAARLGLPATATADEIVRAAMAQLDTLVPRAHLDEAVARAARAEGDLARIQGEQHAASVKATLEGAREAGKIPPAAMAHYERMCATPEGLAQVKALIETLPSITAADPRRDDNPPGAAPKLTKQQRKLAADMGLSEEEFLASLTLDGADDD